jgi:hypothetical protein
VIEVMDFTAEEPVEGLADDRRRGIVDDHVLAGLGPRPW